MSGTQIVKISVSPMYDAGGSSKPIGVIITKHIKS